MTQASTTVSSEFGVQTLEEASKHRRGEGALSVVFGAMSAGKIAIGLAYARTVLIHGGFVMVCLPSEGGTAATREPADIERRLAPSIGRVDEQLAWREHVLVLDPQAANAAKGESPAQRAGGFHAVLSRGNYFPEAASKVSWRNRMVVIHDYNVMRRSEPALSPARLRGLALEHQLNIVVLADCTGGDREIARIAGGNASDQAQALVSILAPLVQDNVLGSQETDLLQTQLPGLARAIDRKLGGGELAAGADVALFGSRAVRVQADQVSLAEAAHRVVYVEKASGDTLLLHTLKSPQGAQPARELELDKGFLAWPPEKLSEMPPSERDRPARAVGRGHVAAPIDHMHAESPRG